MLQFPPNCATKVLTGETKVPTEPPSVCGIFCHLYLARPNRNSRVNQKSKNVTSEIVALKNAVKDIIDTFDGLMWYCKKSTPNNFVVNSASGTTTILKFHKCYPPDIKYSLLICDSFQFNASRGHAKVAT